MNYNFFKLKENLKKVEEWLKKELAQIRTGRASPSLLDSIQVEAYGSKVPINQVGSISSEDVKTLRVSPWDMSQAKSVEKAIMSANLGVSVVADDKGVRVSFPSLTTETRTALVKIAKGKLEEAKKTLRADRDKVWNEIQEMEKKGEMTEDEKFRFKNEMQRLVDEEQKKLDDLAAKKEAEIMS